MDLISLRKAEDTVIDIIKKTPVPNQEFPQWCVDAKRLGIIS